MRHEPAIGSLNGGVSRVWSRGGRILPGAFFEIVGGVALAAGVIFTVAMYGLAIGDGLDDDSEIAKPTDSDRQPLYGLVFSSDRRLFATYGREADIGVYETERGTPIAWLESSGAAPSAIALSGDGNRLVAGYYDFRVLLWVDLLSDPQPMLLGTARGHLRSLALSNDGTLLAGGDVDGNLVLWDVERGSEQLVIFAHETGVHAVALSPDGTRVLTGGGDGVCSLREVATGSELQRFSGHAGLVNAVAFSPDGQQIASCGLDRTLRVWDAAGGNELWCREADLYSVRTVEFSSDGRIVASGGVDKIIKLWDAQTGRRLAVFEGHERGVSRVLFVSVDGRSVASAGYDGTIRFWDKTTAQQTRCIMGE